MHVFMQFVPMLVIALIVGICLSVRALWVRGRKAKAERMRQAKINAEIARRLGIDL